MTSRHKLTKLPMILSFLLVACTLEKTTGTGAPPPPPRTPLTGWHVSASGTTGSAGNSSAPWSLAYALAGAGGQVQPGDTVWLHGGTYRGAFVATVAGAPGKPVVI